MSPLALGIDVGTSGVRVAALEPDGRVVAIEASAMTDHGPNLRDPAIWDAALRQALSALGGVIDLARVGAVSVDGTSGTIVGLDRHGAPVGDGLMYNDAVADPAIPAAIAAHATQDSAAHGAASALARAIEMQERPGVTAILHQADWVASLLAGHAVGSDESNALKTGYDPMARCWPDWLFRTGLKTALLPDVVPAGAVTGACRGDAGLPAAAKLVAGVTDGCASFLATGADQPGDGVTALGTTLTIKLLSDRPIFDPEHGVYSHRIGEMWLAGGASNTGGGVLAQHFDPEQIGALSARLDPEHVTGLDYYPLIKPGERFPVRDPDYAPRLEPRPEDDALFLHGMLEGMAMIESSGFRKLQDAGGPPLRRLRSVGGGARNGAWTAIRRRVLGVPFLDAESTDAAVGVARLALPHLSS